MLCGVLIIVGGVSLGFCFCFFLKHILCERRYLSTLFQTLSIDCLAYKHWSRSPFTIVYIDVRLEVIVLGVSCSYEQRHGYVLCKLLFFLKKRSLSD